MGDMKNVLKVLFWIIAIILFPITAGLYFIWPSKIFKDRMSQNWKTFWWIRFSFRMVEGFDGEMVTDWDGTYITVDILNDTIILRNGWVH